MGICSSRKTILLFLALILCHVSNAQRIVCDETCKLVDAPSASATALSARPAQTDLKKNQSDDPVPLKTDSNEYAVVSPVGCPSVEMISQADRLETLDGKTIAIVGVSFMTSVTHPEIKRLILENYPSAKVILLDEIGIAGPYPAPGITRKQKGEFQAKLKQMGVDAVISGNGGCGLCTPKETGSCIAAEYLGIPSVMIAGPGFVDQARYTALNNGVPVMRVAQYPGAFATHTRDELIRNTREILWPQIVEALTKPILDEERSAGIAGSKGDIRDDVFYGTIDEINEYFKDMNWSDGLPIVPPTFEKVESFLKYRPEVGRDCGNSSDCTPEHESLARGCQCSDGRMQERVYANPYCTYKRIGRPRVPSHTCQHSRLDSILLAQRTGSAATWNRLRSGTDQRGCKRRHRPLYESCADESLWLLCQAGPYGDLRLSHVVVYGGRRRSLSASGMEAISRKRGLRT